MTVLVTGGAGFIGSHACVELADHGYEIAIVDDFSNSRPGVIEVLRQLTGSEIAVHQVDIRDARALGRVFDRNDVTAVIHFAAKKAVGESTQIPLEYFDVNIGGTINLLRAMSSHGVHKLVFSSSCSIYGDGYSRPIAESDRPEPANPYARSKLACEQIIGAARDADPDLAAISLRYFNPAGAHPSGILGERPHGVPGNIVPHIMKVAAGKLDKLHVFGSDYDTPDGTAIRDYIHVMDVAEAHVLALRHLDNQDGPHVLNLGTGGGLSVLELVSAFEEACGIRLPYTITDRRPGDVARLVADCGLAASAWGWRTSRGVTDLLRDAWRFEQRSSAG
ncbi:MAG TPA: UDP-glucose 4-epimerase GalE [Streptosporangiaceae bacterium]|nr:UDP-glucose 4-epimerase GalE [Streptosporangiaceae bacterium]